MDPFSKLCFKYLQDELLIHDCWSDGEPVKQSEEDHVKVKAWLRYFNIEVKKVAKYNCGFFIFDFISENYGNVEFEKLRMENMLTFMINSNLIFF